LPDFFKANVVIAPVHIGRIAADLSFADLSVDERSDLTECVVLRIAADIEYFVGHPIDGRLQRHYNCPCDIIDMHEWTPLVRPGYGDDPVANRFGAKQIDNQIEPRPSRNTVDRRKSQASHGKLVIAKRTKHSLRTDLGSRIQRLRVEARAFIDDVLGGAIDRTGAREYESPNPARFGDFTDELGRRNIDVRPARRDGSPPKPHSSLGSKLRCVGNRRG
jgi:hypothetical protein